MIGPEAINLRELPWLPLEAEPAFPRQPSIKVMIQKLKLDSYSVKLGVSKV